MGRMDMSVASLKKLGMQKAAQHPGKPAFTVKEFLDGKKKREAEIADDFIKYVQEYYKKNEPDFTNIQDKLAITTINPKKVITALKKKGKLVFVGPGFVIGEYTYKEIWSILEFGRMDVGIMPQPILRACFDSYKPHFNKMVKEFLKGKQ